MPKAKAWKIGAPGEPDFPAEHEIIKKAVLQVTDIKTNRNKYYAIELHAADGAYRVFTHYGRTDDLESNPNAGTREGRYFPSLHEAEASYSSIYGQKTSSRKGYKEVNLASSRIGSERAQGTSSGHVDAKTIERTRSKTKKKVKVPKSSIPPGVENLVRLIYDEATNALTSTVAAKITANGIETPLGVLTIGQIEQGEDILLSLYELFQKRQTKRVQDQMVSKSGEFYTVIPHRIGRTRKAAESAVIASLEEFEQKQETLQLMKDMLKVNGEEGQVLFDTELDAKYKALNCTIEAIPRKSSEFEELKALVEKSQIKTKTIRVQDLYRLERPTERTAFDRSVGNEMQLMHGSRAKNWVGLLSRGILLPKIVVTMGVQRTDPGWLGNGIYFGDAACTSLYYTSPTKRGTRFLSLARVAMGKVKKYRKISFGLPGPPKGYDSCHGVRATKLRPSQFEDDEYVVYRADQQQLEYLVEFKV